MDAPLNGQRKKDLVEKARLAWSKEPVSLQMIDADSLRNIMKNPSDKLFLINIWRTSSDHSTNEFQNFITINRMYRDRDFQFISISADSPDNRDKVLEFLQTQQASNINYLFNGNDKNKLIETVDPSWRGVLPYTILVEPGGKIVYKKTGTIDPANLKTTIVNNHLIGKYP